ncbi:MAG: radical SAM protein [Microthrixaceae bacterium]
MGDDGGVRDMEPGSPVMAASPTAQGAAPATACHAPSVQLFLQPDGAVRACCRQLVAHANIAEQSLLDIWTGATRRELVDRLACNDWSGGCENCGQEVSIEGRTGSYPAFFDVRATHLTSDPETGRWPRWIDFNLSNACNLQCAQCSGDLSSAIRIHRERRPPLVSPYGDSFFEDLRVFIPHLDGALFAGGEPFLAAENYRVWDLIAELNPSLTCTVTTNGTQWNERVEQVLERLRFNIVISFDGVDAPTFESIRVGAVHAEVLENIRRFQAYAERVGTRVSLNHCLMPQNVDGFADLLIWAEGEGLGVDVSVVREPPECSISHLPPEELSAVHRRLLTRHDDVHAGAPHNATVWDHELHRIGAWAAQAASPEGIGELDRTVMFFRIAGSGPVDGRDVADELRTADATAVLCRIDVDTDDIIVGVSESAHDLLGPAATEMIGRHFSAVEDVTVARFGERRHYEVTAQGPDRLDATATYGSTRFTMSFVAERDTDGTAHGGTILTLVDLDER